MLQLTREYAKRLWTQSLAAFHEGSLHLITLLNQVWIFIRTTASAFAHGSIILLPAGWNWLRTTISHSLLSADPQAPTVRNFLHAVVTNTLTLMSGALSVPFAGFAAFSDSAAAK